MANLTLVIDDDTLKRARLKALASDTSVNALVREFIADYAGDSRATAVGTVLEMAARSEASVGDAGWTRDELHER